MKEIKFDEIRMRHTRTTKGKWHKCEEKGGLFSIKTNFDLVCENLIEEDANFIAHAKQDIADLLNYIIETEKK
jgi:hypothetical protein